MSQSAPGSILLVMAFSMTFTLLIIDQPEFDERRGYIAPNERLSNSGSPRTTTGRTTATATSTPTNPPAPNLVTEPFQVSKRISPRDVHGSQSLGGSDLYSRYCAECHDTRPPRLGNPTAWVDRFARGLDALQTFVVRDSTHAPATRQMNSRQINKTISYMMAKTFWPDATD